MTLCGLPAIVNVEVLNCAVPPPLNVIGTPALLPSITNWTVPVGVPDPGATAATVAVKVTLCPLADGFCDDTNRRAGPTRSG